MAIHYSDGDIEGKILTLIRKAKELGSAHAIAVDEYDEWAVKYHLCPERSQLLRHLDFGGCDVLEIGAGMGAVSRYLAESAKSLTVVEGTEARFAVLSERLRDLKNWKGSVANFQDWKSDARFDVVCLIGVLEYSELYVKAAEGESPFAHMLSHAKSFLKEGGVVIVAIENKLGLKYWSGAAEDHTSKMFDNICDYPLTKTAQTFSRRELKRLLTEVGLKTIDEAFPFPDYKIPSSVLTSEFIDEGGEIVADVATLQPFENYTTARVKYFPELLAVKSVAKAGMLADMANSFLMIACENKTSAIRKNLLNRQLEKKEVGWHYSNGRKNATTTVFSKGKSGLRVTKSPVLKATETFRAGAVELSWRALGERDISSGVPLRFRLAKQAYFGQWNDFTKTLADFLTWSFANWKKGEAFDALWVNTLEHDGKYEQFDLEWVLSSELPKSWFVFRNVATLLREKELFTSEAPFKTFRELYESLCKKLDVTPDFAGDVGREATVQSLVSRDSIVERHRDHMNVVMQTKFPPTKFPRNPNVERSRQWTFQTLTSKVKKAAKRVPVAYSLAKRVKRFVYESNT